MSDETNSSNATPSPAPQPSAFSGAAPPMSPGEVKDGKVFAILSYVITIAGIPFWLLPVIIRNNDFALYHAKQAATIWIVYAIAVAAGVVVSIVTLGIGACIAMPVLGIIGLGLLVLIVIGALNAINEQAKPLPFIGTYAEKWFAGLKKA